MIWLRTLMGKASLMSTTKLWPHPSLRVFSAAVAFRSSSFPSTLTRRSPEDSQNARPNFTLGVEVVMAS